jgi:carbamate kinase
MENSNHKVAVVAVGGNALIKEKGRTEITDQYAAAAETMAHVATMIEAGWNVVITHGNGPQVGFMQRRSELSASEMHAIPLDYSGAHTQGSIAYMFERALYNEFQRRGLHKPVVGVVTQVLVSRDDPAFARPSKPIGSFMDEVTAVRHRDHDGWGVMEDSGRGWRRVVASPTPLRIIQRDAIVTLINAGYVVIGVGGGGVPVIETDSGQLEGAEVVIDKDLASALLASSIEANLLLISTEVEKVALNFGKPEQRWLDTVALSEARQYLADGHFGKGSMEPKIRAIIGYLERGGQAALVTNPPNIARALAGQTGTWIRPD